MPSWALPWRYSGCNRRLRSLRDFCDRLRDPFRFVVQCQIGLRDDANDAILRINDGDSSYLVLLHQTFASLDILTVTACERSQADKFFDFCCFWIQALRHDQAAQVPVRDHPDEFTRLLTCHHGHGADVAITQDLGDRLCAVAEHAADWIAVHDFSNFHGSPPRQRQTFMSAV